MPPFALWLQGTDGHRQVVRRPGGRLRGLAAAADRGQRMRRVRGVQAGPRGGHAPFAIQVIEISPDGWIIGLHHFLDADLFPAFGLPTHLPAEEDVVQADQPIRPRSVGHGLSHPNGPAQRRAASWRLASESMTARSTISGRARWNSVISVSSSTTRTTAGRSLDAGPGHAWRSLSCSIRHRDLRTGRSRPSQVLTNEHLRTHRGRDRALNRLRGLTPAAGTLGSHVRDLHHAA